MPAPTAWACHPTPNVEECGAALCVRREVAFGATHKGWRYSLANHRHFFNGLLTMGPRMAKDDGSADEPSLSAGHSVKQGGSDGANG